MTTTKSFRATIAAFLEDRAVEYATFQHRRNFHRLHIHRDGTTTWTEFSDRNSDIIDRQAAGFAAVPSLAVVGTGSYTCNCDHCGAVYNARDEQNARDDGRPYNRDEKYDSVEDAVADAVAGSDLGEVERMLAEALERVEVGYFEDEE